VVSAEYHRYIQLCAIAGSSLIPAVLNNFSCHGILFECTEVLDAGTHAECVLSVPHLPSRDILFEIAVRYCKKGTGLPHRGHNRNDSG
jgi:hypothetical protein